MSRNPQPRMRTNHFSNGQSRNNFRTSMSAEKSFEKYSSLAKEAMSAGDKTLSENYLQHADHYMRIIGIKNQNLNKDLNKNEITENKNVPEANTNPDLDNTTKEKKE